MRTYALSGGNHLLSGLAAFLAIGPIAVQLVSPCLRSRDEVVVMLMTGQILSIKYQAVKNFPSPLNCSTVNLTTPSLDWM